MNKLLLFLCCFLLSYSYMNAQSTSPGSRPLAVCPNVNIAVARADFNVDSTNPYYIYSVNSSNGSISLYPGGPLRDPGNPTKNLQVNGIGINPKDCFVYGMVYAGNAATAAFTKFDYNYGVTTLGNIAPPTSATGTLAFVNSSAGDVDKSDNFYFTGVTANSAPNTPTGLIIDKLFLGKIANISNITGTPPVVYSEIDYSDVATSDFIVALATDPNNGGIKDFSFNPVTKSFFTYGTYILNGASGYIGQLFELKPLAGSSPLKYKVFAYPIVNRNSSETTGSYIDKSGNFVVLLTDGTMGTLRFSDSAFHYSGKFDTLSLSTGFPNPIRADMGSYGAPDISLPVTLSLFKGFAKDCKTTSFTWISQTEINLKRYELQESVDGSNGFITIASVSANNVVSGSSYTYAIPSAGKLALYRLKMVDIDGQVTYSPVVPINNACIKGRLGFIINPNPASDVVNINWYGVNAATTVNLHIYNAIGALMLNTDKSVASGSSTSSINVSTFSSGVYVIKGIDSQTNESFEQKFVKK